LSFGLWGAIAWLWFWGASLRVMYCNFKHGSPALRTINLLLFASYIGKAFIFVFIFGALSSDTMQFAGLVGLSVAVNNGLCRPATRPVQVRPPAMAGAFPAPRPAFQR